MSRVALEAIRRAAIGFDAAADGLDPIFASASCNGFLTTRERGETMAKTARDVMTRDPACCTPHSTAPWIRLRN